MLHRDFGYSVRNNGWVSILDSAVAYGLSIVNSFFKKREEHLVMLKSESTRTQIDYFLVRANRRRWCTDF